MTTGRTGWIVLAAGGAAVALAGGLLAFGTHEEPGGTQSHGFVLPVRLAPVELRDVAPTVELTGSLRAVRRARVGFEVAGVVSSLAVSDGDLVRRGQVLATLDGRDQALVVRTREAELRVAQRELERMVAGPRVEEKRRLAAELEIARADQALARLEVERGRALLERAVISQADLDRLRSAEEAAAARTAAASERLAEAEAGARAEDVAIARAGVERARAALALARREQAKTQLRAPWDGAVVRRFVSVGDYAAPGGVAFELVDPDLLEVEAAIPARYAPRLGASPRVVLQLDELPGFRHEARLDAEVPVADELSRNFAGLLRLDRRALPPEAAAVLRPGMFARLALELEPLRGQLVVPADAVRVTQDGLVVVRAVPSPPQAAGSGAAAAAAAAAPGAGPPPLTAAFVPVRVLGADRAGKAVAPLEGELLAGDQVVVTGVDLAFPGAPLAPQPAPDPREPAAVVAEEQAAQ